MWKPLAFLLQASLILGVPQSSYRQSSSGGYGGCSGGRCNDDNLSLLASLLDSLGEGGLSVDDYYEGDDRGYGNEITPQENTEISPFMPIDAEPTVCEPQVVTNTRLVHSTIFATRTQALPTTVFTQITQTVVVPTTVFMDQVISSVAPPVVHTRTDIVTDTAYITRAQYITETAFVTQTQFQHVTTTVRDVRTQRVTRTDTRYQVKTKYETQFDTHYQTVVSTTTYIQYVTQQQQVPHYVTKSVVSSYPVIQTVTHTQIMNNYHTVTYTTTLVKQVPAYQTVVKTQFQPQYVTYTSTVPKEVPVYHTFTSYKVHIEYKTVQAPCAPPPVQQGYF